MPIPRPLENSTVSQPWPALKPGLRKSSKLGREFAGYGLALFLCSLLMAWSLRLWQADLTVPYSYHNDGLFTQLWIKTTLEEGWYLDNPRVGAPFGLDLRDFPLSDSLHFFVLQVTTLFSSDAAVLYNVYFLLTFPLTVLSAHFVLRKLGIRVSTSIVCSLLFTFLPYHFFRGMIGHLFLAAYFLVPWAILVAIRLGGFTRNSGSAVAELQAHTSWNRLSVTGAVVLAVLMACGGIYYAFFACYLFLVAGIHGAFRQRSLKPVAMAAGLGLVVLLTTLANVSPTLVKRWTCGSNPEAVERSLAGPDLLGLKITQLLWPTSAHRLNYFRERKRDYMRVMPAGNGDYWYLGAVGAAGFLYLITRLIRKPSNGPGADLLGILSVLNIFALLLATSGGLGLYFSMFLGSWIRAYERMSIYLAFFSLAAIGSLLDRLRTAIERAPSGRLCGRLFLLGLLGFGVWDQTSSAYFRSHQKHTADFESDRTFVQSIEKVLTPGAKVFQLPYVPFPEHWPVVRMIDYDHLRGYLHSQKLCWSYGAVKGRQGNAWLRSMAGLPVRDLLASIRNAGFEGIYVDRFGYEDRAAGLEAELRSLLQTEPLVSPNKRLAFFALEHAVQHVEGSDGAN